LAPLHQAAEETRLASIAFIKGDPRKGQPVAAGDIVQLQADPPLGPVGHRLGNPGGAAPGSVLAPRFRKKSSLSSRQWNGPSTNTKWTLTMQLSFLPVAAQYWC
jgi:hypothetical protein